MSDFRILFFEDEKERKRMIKWGERDDKRKEKSMEKVSKKDGKSIEKKENENML